MSTRKVPLVVLTFLILLALSLSACNSGTPTPTASVYSVGCSEQDLISAINQANNSAGPAVINLDYCIYILTEVDNTAPYSGLSINSGLPEITSEITIQGNSAVIKIQPASGEPDFGHFFVSTNGNLAIYDLRLQYGYRPLGGSVLVQGGDFLSSGVEFVDNMADGDVLNSPASGGAIYNDGGQVVVKDQSVFLSNQAGVPRAGTQNLGGAIFNVDGTLTVIDSTFKWNKSASDGGAIYSIKSPSYSGGGAIIIDGSEFEENEAGVNGGGIALKNEVEGAYLTNSKLALNTADNYGGALYSEDSDLSVIYSEFSDNSADHGGAAYFKRSAEGVLSEVRVEFSDLSENRALGKGGAVFSENVDLTIADSSIEFNDAKTCAGVQNGGTPDLDHDLGDLLTAPRIISTSEIYDSNFENNIANSWQKYQADGGGLCHVMGDLRISGTNFIKNTAFSYGGGLLVLDDLELTDSLFEDNKAVNGGGMSVGVVLENYEWYPGIDVNITDCVFFHNLALRNSSSSGGYGAGMLHFTDGTTTLNKTTFERNFAAASGGGIYQSQGNLYLTNSTLSSNRGDAGGIRVYGGFQQTITGLNHVTVARSLGSGISTFENVNLSVYKSLLYENYGGDVDLSTSTFLNASGNVIQNGPPALGTTFPAGSPMIGPLVGSTHPVLPGSPLIDFLSSCGEPDDQRTVIRPQGAGCEPGSYEYNGEDDVKADIPDIPQFELDLDESSDNCEPFNGMESDVYTLGLPGTTMNLPVVLRVDGEIPGWDPEMKEISPLFDFSATLGDLESYDCSPQGYPDRLICMFHIPDHAPGMALDFALYLNDCGDAVQTYPLISIPQPTAVCRIDLEEEECEVTGGAYLDLDEPYCLCP